MLSQKNNITLNQLQDDIHIALFDKHYSTYATFGPHKVPSKGILLTLAPNQKLHTTAMTILIQIQYHRFFIISQQLILYIFQKQHFKIFHNSKKASMLHLQNCLFYFRERPFNNYFKTKDLP